MVEIAQYDCKFASVPIQVSNRGKYFFLFASKRWAISSEIRVFEEEFFLHLKALLSVILADTYMKKKWQQHFVCCISCEELRFLPLIGN